MKTHLILAVASALLVLILTAVTAYIELRAFKDDVLKQQALVQKQIRKQEQALHETVLQVQEQTSTDVSSIDRAYTELLNERGLFESDSSNGRVHETAAATGRSGQTENTKPLATSARLSKQLRACEARLIYEAKEYDILATHYNALLAIYKRAQEVSNGNGKEDGDRKGHG